MSNGSKKMKKNICRFKKRKRVFNSFEEYWRLTRDLPDKMRATIVDALSENDHQRLMMDMQANGWIDLVKMDKFDSLVDAIKEQTGIDIYDLKYKVSHGHGVYMPKSRWNQMIEIIAENAVSDDDIENAIGLIDVTVCHANKKVVFVCRKGEKE